MMTNSSVASKLLDGNVYVGVPLIRNGTSKLAFTDSESKTFGRCDGFRAFVVGMVSASFVWFTNQGLVILSVLLFGPLTVESMFKCWLFCTFGCIFTLIAYWAVVKMCFPGVFEGSNDEDDEKNPSYEKDVWCALEDLCELGFFFGQVVSHVLFADRLYKSLGSLWDVEYVKYRTGLDMVYVALILLWMVCSKMRDYKRAMERANNVEHTTNVEPADTLA